MPNYTAPVEDMMFLFDKLRNNRNYNEIEKYKDVNTELVKDILVEAAKIWWSRNAKNCKCFF